MAVTEIAPDLYRISNMPYTKRTGDILRGLADLKPRTIAPMHGSAYAGDGGRALRDLAEVMREVLG